VTVEPTSVPRLHVITDDDTLARPDWVDVARSVLDAGGASLALHVRGPHSTGRVVFDLANALLETARRAGAWLVVNDRADVAKAVGAHAVHLGRRSLPANEVRKHVFPRGRLGVSCHSVDAVSRARADGADYAFAGTVFPTKSHPEEAGIGIEGFAGIALSQPDFPVLAIGGVSVESTGGLVSAGAHGVAVMGGIWDAKDPAAAATGFLAELSVASGQSGRTGSLG